MVPSVWGVVEVIVILLALVPIALFSTLALTPSVTLTVILILTTIFQMEDGYRGEAHTMCPLVPRGKPGGAVPRAHHHPQARPDGRRQSRPARDFSPPILFNCLLSNGG